MRVDHKAKDTICGILPLIREYKGKPVMVNCVYASGTLKQALKRVR